MTCRLTALRYGCTTGRPSGVVQMTDVISSLASRVLVCAAVAAPTPRAGLTVSFSAASATRDGGIDRDTSRAEVESQSMMALAPENKSPIQLRTCAVRRDV